MKRMRWADHVACMGEKGSAYRAMVGNSEGKRPPGRPGWRWEDIEMNLKKIGW
jgi:hypothetical protein